MPFNFILNMLAHANNKYRHFNILFFNSQNGSLLFISPPGTNDALFIHN